MKRLRNSRVALFGLGGVGSFALEALARAGIGGLLLIDFDLIEVSNLNRQLLALHSTLGEAKVEVACRRVLDINPHARVETRRVKLDELNCSTLLEPGLDYVVDAIDQVSAKVALICQAKRLNQPIISCLGAAEKLDPTAFRIGDISETSVCPLARAVRQRLRARGIESGVKVVYSLEPPRTRADRPRGSISFVPSVAGLLAASVVVNDLIRGSG